MKLKIKKMVLGEEYIFYVYLTVKTEKCVSRRGCTSELLPSYVSPTFEHIIFETPIKLEGYVNGVKAQAPVKIITNLKIPKEKKSSVKEYVLA